MTHEVFISYSREDISHASALVDSLSACGVRYWIDRDTIGGAAGAVFAGTLPLSIAMALAAAELALSDPLLRSARTSIWDGLVKGVLLLRSVRTPVQGGWLTSSRWFAEARSARRPPAGTAPPS